MSESTLAKRIEDAMWAGDVDTLHEIAPCVCCCHEHTFPNCEARMWGGCRSGLPPGYGPEKEYGDVKSWQEHYAKFHGMSEGKFFGWPVWASGGRASKADLYIGRNPQWPLLDPK